MNNSDNQEMVKWELYDFLRTSYESKGAFIDYNLIESFLCSNDMELKLNIPGKDVCVIKNSDNTFIINERFVILEHNFLVSYKYDLSNLSYRVLDYFSEEKNKDEQCLGYSKYHIVNNIDYFLAPYCKDSFCEYGSKEFNNSLYSKSEKDLICKIIPFSMCVKDSLNNNLSYHYGDINTYYSFGKNDELFKFYFEPKDNEGFSISVSIINKDVYVNFICRDEKHKELCKKYCITYDEFIENMPNDYEFSTIVNFLKNLNNLGLNMDDANDFIKKLEESNLIYKSQISLIKNI